MPTSPFDSSKLSRTQKFELQKKYPTATNIFSGPPNMMGSSPTNFYTSPPGNLFGSSPAGPRPQRTGAIVAGEMIPSEAAPFGYKDGQPLFQLPQDEAIRRKEEKEARELKEEEARKRRYYEPDYISKKFPQMGEGLSQASKKIRDSFKSGNISADQARSIADRVMAYYDDKTQEGLFSEITGISQRAPKSRRSRGEYYGQDYRREPQTPFGGGTVKNTYL